MQFCTDCDGLKQCRKSSKTFQNKKVLSSISRLQYQGIYLIPKYKSLKQIAVVKKILTV